MSQSKTVVTSFGEKITISPYANNGLSTNNGFIQLGGALTQPSVLTTTSAFTLAINGLQAGSASDNVLVTDTNGVLKYVSRSSFGGGADNLGNHIATQNLMMNRNDVVFADRLESNTKTFSFYKDNGVFGIYNSNKGNNSLSISEVGNVGIGTASPTNALHVQSSTDPVRIEGLAGSTNSNDAPIVVTSDGTLKKGAFPTINIVPDDVGTVIAIGGKLEVAQEITVLMDADFNFAATSGNTIPIGNFKKIIIDNKNKYTANTTTNNFTVEASGTYQLTMNVLLHLNGSGEYFPVIGVWDNNTSLWTARVNDQYTATSITNNMNKRLQTYTLITAVELTAGKPYSFRIANSSIGGTIIAFSYGNTGSGPASFASLKRLK